jgi:hypothetical protein
MENRNLKFLIFCWESFLGKSKMDKKNVQNRKGEKYFAKKRNFTA